MATAITVTIVDDQTKCRPTDEHQLGFGSQTEEQVDAADDRDRGNRDDLRLLA